MKIKQIQEDYNLTKEDFWQHPQSGKYVLYHNAVEKIAAQENIELVNYDTLNSQLDLVRFVMTMKMGDKTITDIGEADPKNCKMGYFGCMAFKRGFDRCVLKLIKAYQYDIVSEEEADDWKFQYQSPTDDMKTKYQELLEHKVFDGKRPDINRRWKDQHNNYMQNMALDWMQSQIDEHKKAKKTDATDIVKEQNENLKRISKEG